MVDSELFSSENKDQKQYIRVFSEDEEEAVLSIPFADSITVNQLITEVIGSEDDNMFVTKKGSPLVLQDEITTSTDVTSRPSGLLFSNSVYALRQSNDNAEYYRQFYQVFLPFLHGVSSKCDRIRNNRTVWTQ